jgi:hypothetical protein
MGKKVTERSRSLVWMTVIAPIRPIGFSSIAPYAAEYFLSILSGRN